MQHPRPNFEGQLSEKQDAFHEVPECWGNTSALSCADEVRDCHRRSPASYFLSFRVHEWKEEPLGFFWMAGHWPVLGPIVCVLADSGAFAVLSGLIQRAGCSWMRHQGCSREPFPDLECMFIR